MCVCVCECVCVCVCVCERVCVCVCLSVFCDGKECDDGERITRYYVSASVSLCFVTERGMGMETVN